MKRTLVLVHGFVQNSKLFNEQVEYFKSLYNIIALDLRGHGSNSDKNGPYGNEEYTDDIQDFFDQHKLSNVIFWGTHTGSGVGINLYLRDNRYIDTLIFEGVVIPGKATPDISNSITRVKNTYIKDGLINAQKDWIENSNWYKYMNENPEITRKKEQYAIVSEFTGKPWACNLAAKNVNDMTSNLYKINCNCLIYNGINDSDDFIKMANVFQSMVHCEKAFIPDSGGFPLWDNPKYVNKFIESWLKNEET